MRYIADGASASCEIQIPRTIYLLLDCVNADALAVTAVTLEANLTVDRCKQCVIRADADIVARMNMCAALTNENVARQNVLTVAALYAKTLCLGITAVLCGTNALLVSEELHADTDHFNTPPFSLMLLHGA